MHRVIALVLLLLLLIGVCLPARAADLPPAIYLNTKSASVRQAVQLAQEYGTLWLMATPDDADGWVIDLATLDLDEATRLRDLFPRTGASPRGMVILFDGAAGEDANAKLQALTGQILATQVISTPISLVTDAAVADDFYAPLRRWLGLEQANATPGQTNQPLDPLVSGITWRSAPQVRERTAIPAGTLDKQAVLVRNYQGVGEADLPAEAVIAELPATAEHGQIYLVTPWLVGDQNLQFQQWAYFNYLFYHMSARAAGATPAGFSDWAASPVPHQTFQYAFLSFYALVAVAAIGVFLVIRVRSPKLAAPVLVPTVAAEAEQECSPEIAENEAPAKTENAWERIGFHRPLAGFLIYTALGFLTVLPMMGFGSVVVPQYLLPFPAALGGWGLVGGLFALFWPLFDIGTGTASIKFFSQFRVRDPARAMAFMQLYVWWQAITGLIQIAIVAAIAFFYVPHTAYAYLAFFFIGQAIFQFPGFLGVFSNLFSGLQRFDRLQILTIIASFYGIVYLITVPLGRWWGSSNPRFGEAFGAIAGTVVASMLVSFIVFFIGMWFYRQMGYDPRHIFRASFDRQTVATMLPFGFKVLLTGISLTLAATIQTFLMERTVINYTELLAIWGVAGSLGFVYNLVLGLSGQMMPALSEAYHAGRIMLCRYYTALTFKYGGMFNFFVASALIPVADRFLAGSLGPQWQRAADLAVISLVSSFFIFPAAFSDSVQQGTGRPGLQVILTAGEQTLKIILVFLLLPPLQIYGLILAIMIPLQLKGLVAWLVNRKLLFDPSIQWWQTVVAPFGAAAINYALLRVIGNLFWQPTLLDSSILLALALLLSIPVYFFFNGLFGGWDSYNLAQFKQAMDLTGWARPVVMSIYLPSLAGARLSPLHNRFPLRLYEAANAEAEQLTAEKVAMV